MSRHADNFEAYLVRVFKKVRKLETYQDCKAGTVSPSSVACHDCNKHYASKELIL